MNQRTKLWNKVNEEYDIFKNELLQQSKNDIFENAYKIAIYDNCIDLCDPDLEILSEEQVNILLDKSQPIDLLYNLYLKSESGGTMEFYDSIWYRLNECKPETKKHIDEREDR